MEIDSLHVFRAVVMACGCLFAFHGRGRSGQRGFELVLCMIMLVLVIMSMVVVVVVMMVMIMIVRVVVRVMVVALMSSMRMIMGAVKCENSHHVDSQTSRTDDQKLGSTADMGTCEQSFDRFINDLDTDQHQEDTIT